MENTCKPQNTETINLIFFTVQTKENITLSRRKKNIILKCPIKSVLAWLNITKKNIINARIYEQSTKKRYSNVFTDKINSVNVNSFLSWMA